MRKHNVKEGECDGDRQGEMRPCMNVANGSRDGVSMEPCWEMARTSGIDTDGFCKRK